MALGEVDRAFHYLELDLDLSDIMFVTTANSLNLPQPLLDRMEIIRLEGYTEDEKVEIAKRHLLPKQLRESGLQPENLHLTEDGLKKLIRGYTREAGLRNLERELGSIYRKLARRVAELHAGQLEAPGRAGGPAFTLRLPAA